MRIVVTVKTHPNPSTKYDETVCTAGVDLDAHRFVRLSRDARGDTYTPNPDPITTVDKLYRGKKPDWGRRDAWCASAMTRSFTCRPVLPSGARQSRMAISAGAGTSSVGLPPMGMQTYCTHLRLTN